MSDPFDRVLRAAARRSRGAGVCPDADVLAAYLDNGLTSGERATVEAHAADCALCQQHLGLLGAVSLEVRPPEVEAARSWLAQWGWLVPVATAVLVVTIWTRIDGPDTSPTLQDQVASAPAARPSDYPPATPPPASADPRAARKSDVPEAQAESTAPPQPPAALTGRERRDNAARPAPPPPAADAAPAPAAVAEADRFAQVAGAARAPAEAEAKEKAAESVRQEAALLRKAAAPAHLAAASLTETYRASGGRIERSRDGGATWLEAFADPALTFTTSACATGGPCWFGTATGAVIRTSAAGFVRSQLPEMTPVISITPGPALEAVAATAVRRYRTTDGTAWHVVP
jgi:hypothetical protein